MSVPDWLADLPQVHHRIHLPGQQGRTAEWPAWLPDVVRESLQRKGFTKPWLHQVEAADHAHAGRHTVISTPTASGKSLAFLMPVLAATWGGDPTSAPPAPPVRPSSRLLLRRPHTAIYLSPTKALAHDQLRAWREVDLPSWRIGTLDGDSDTAERAWARDHAAVLLTNPDMLHRSVLPAHERWHQLLANLRFVVVDELHHCRGSFGAQVGLVLRRLLRLCEHHGSTPVVIAASASLADPAQTLSDLIAVPAPEVAVVAEDHSPHPDLDLLLARADDRPDELAATISARLAAEGTQTCTFVRSRVVAEDLAARIHRSVPRGVPAAPVGSDPVTPSGVSPPGGDPLTPASVSVAYRGGLLPMERRALERQLAGREVMSVVSTSALELGVDISGLDAVVLCGHPGSPASLWQRLGRAGRADRAALGVLVAANNPLDAWWCDHPEELVAARTEPPRNLPNRRQLLLQLAAAAQELPLRSEDARWFGPGLTELCDQLAAAGVLRRRHTGWFWTRPDRAVDLIDLRGDGHPGVEICHRDTGRVVGHLDVARLDTQAHPGAIYRHQGEPWQVLDRDEDAGVVWVEPAPGGWTTQALSETEVGICADPGIDESHPSDAGVMSGEVLVRTRVTGYLRRDEITGTVWDRSELQLPTRELTTTGVWFEVPASALTSWGWGRARARAACHAFEHVLQALTPSVVDLDPSELSGWHTRAAGGWQIGVFARSGDARSATTTLAAQSTRWLAAVIDRLATCECSTGCPRCVLAPGCPEANQQLDRGGALVLARLLSEALRPEHEPVPDRVAPAPSGES